MLVSPYSWLEEYTPLDEWFGGVDGGGEEGSDSFLELQKFIG